MEPIDLLITARWIIPIDERAESSNRVLEHHAIAIRQGRIAAVLPTSEALKRYRATEQVDRPHHVLLPGLINAHTHAGMTLLRGAAENLGFDAWLKERIWPLEQRWLDPEFVRDGIELAIAGMLASGTTCFAEQYLFPDVIAQTVSQLHMRASVGLPIIDIPTAWAGSADEYLDKGLRLHDEYREDPLIATAFAPHSPYTVADAALERIRRSADEIELPVMMHLHESPQEIATDTRPIQRMEQMGLLTPLFSAVHMTQVVAADIECAVRCGISVVHCPQSNLKLGNGLCPVGKLLARGVNVALGTDSAASNNDLDMLDELRTAALLAPLATPDHRITAYDWLKIATLNGARALGLADSIGSLQPGKWADLVCIDLKDVHTQPVHDPATAIVYSASRAQVTDTYVAGRALWSNRAYTHLNLDSLLRRTSEWQQRITAS